MLVMSGGTVIRRMGLSSDEIPDTNVAQCHTSAGGAFNSEQNVSCILPNRPPSDHECQPANGSALTGVE